MDQKEDTIKNRLQKRPRMQDTIDTAVRQVTGVRKGSLRDISDVSNPTDSSVVGSISLGQIEKVVDRVNYGQQELERMKRMEDSPGYRFAVQAADTVKGWVGKKPVRAKDPFQLFQYQQDNVRELNRLLAGMTSLYTADVEYTRGELDDIVQVTSKEFRRKGDYEKKVIPPIIAQYNDAKTQLEKTDKEEDPEAHFTALANLIEMKRESRKARFEYVVTAMSKNHHEEQIENLMLQEELFETMLYGVMNMAAQTELYQRTLDNNIKIWKPIGDISKAVYSVSDGVQVLAQFNRLLNQSYIDTVRNVATIIDSHPGTQMIIDTNADLRDLVADVNASQYRQAEQFMR